MPRPHREILFVAAAGNRGRAVDRRPYDGPAARQSDRGTAANANAKLAPGANWGRASVDLMAPAEGLLVTGFLGEPRAVSGLSYAAVRITARAACLLAVHLDWRAADLSATRLSHPG